jgi:hypothetical protein
VVSVCLWLGFWAITLLALAWWRSVRQVPAREPSDQRYAA